MPRKTKYTEADFYNQQEVHQLVHQSVDDAFIDKAVRLIERKLGWAQREGMYAGTPWDIFQEFITRILEMRIRWLKSDNPDLILLYILCRFWLPEANRKDWITIGRERILSENEDWDNLYSVSEASPEDELIAAERVITILRNLRAAAERDERVGLYLELQEEGIVDKEELMRLLGVSETELESLKRKIRRAKVIAASS